MHDQDMMTESVLNKSAFDEHGPYDLDYGAGPSRPTPKPYDDLHSDPYSLSPTDYSARTGESSGRRNVVKGQNLYHPSEGRGRGRSRGRGNYLHNHSRASFRERRQHYLASAPNSNSEAYNPRLPQESLPASFMPAQSGREFHLSPTMNPSWGLDDPSLGHLHDRQFYMFPNQQMSSVTPPTFVQPHINPRFASTFGFQLPSGAHLQTALSIPQGLMEQWPTPTLESSEPEFKAEP